MEAAAAAAAEGAAAAAPCSLYRLALANGVSELLDVYRSAVLAVEAHLAHAAAPPPLLAVQQFLLEWELLLPEAAALVGEVERRGLVGAAIMRQLALRAHSGMPALQSCAQRLLWHCRQVLFKQLESWLVHGLLLDRAGEFFIRRAGGAGAGSPRRSAASPSPLRLGDGSAAAGGPMLDWEPLEWHAGFEVRVGHAGYLLLCGGVVEAGGKRRQVKLHSVACNSTAQAPPSKPCMRPCAPPCLQVAGLDALPPGVSLPTAETALFIGKAVRVLRQPMSAAASHQALRAHAEILGFSQALRALQRQEAFSAVQFDHCIETMRAKVRGGAELSPAAEVAWQVAQGRTLRRQPPRLLKTCTPAAHLAPAGVGAAVGPGAAPLRPAGPV